MFMFATAFWVAIISRHLVVAPQTSGSCGRPEDTRLTEQIEREKEQNFEC
ncbi:hypothetical protein BH10CYA1_BH10CYA1_32490 [soil metagenome]